MRVWSGVVGRTFSWNLSELHATKTEKMQEKTHGGALMRRVPVVLKPRVVVRDGCELVSFDYVYGIRQ